MDEHDIDTDPTVTFDRHRELLLGVAYRILGSSMDAEDVVQDAWLRWREVDHAEIEDPRAFLVRVTSRLAIDRLRLARRRRETYVGPWLPEPVFTGRNGGTDDLTTPDVADDVALADSVSLAMLVVLETLSPLERAVFVLREAFAFSYAEIGRALDRNEEAVRQVARRARRHVEERRPRYDTDRATQRRVTERFLAVAIGGDFEELMRLLAPDVTLVGDGGGVAKAPVRTIAGADKVGRFIAGIRKQAPHDPRAYLATVNGATAMVVTSSGEPAVVLSLDVLEGLISTVHVVTNPEKLRALGDIERIGTPIELQ